MSEQTIVELEYRTMKTEDYEACARELMLAFHGEPWNETWTYEQAWTRIDEMMSARVSRGYVIYDGDEVVSMLCGRIMTYFGRNYLSMNLVYPQRIRDRGLVLRC